MSSNKNEDQNQNQNQAHQLLELLLNRLQEVIMDQTAVKLGVGPRNRQRWKRVLDLLAKFPDLSQETFKWGGYPNVLPLSILLNVQGMALEQIQQVHGFYPKAVSIGLRYPYSTQQSSQSPQYDISLYPIDFAIRTASDEIIEFVVREFPQRRPQVRSLEYLWRSRRTHEGPPVSLKTIQMLVQQWPFILSLQFNDGKDPLALAFQNSCKPEILHFLVQSIARQDSNNNNNNNNIYSKTFVVQKSPESIGLEPIQSTSVDRANLKILLPRLSNIDLTTNMPDLVEHAFSLLPQNVSLITVKLTFTGGGGGDSTTVDITNAMYCLVVNNTHMKQLTLTGDFTVDWSSVWNGFRNDKSELRLLYLLRVNDACLPKDVTALAKLIENHNTTLGRLWVRDKNNGTPFCIGREKLDHVLLLNSYNRGLARNLPRHNMSMATLLGQANDRLNQLPNVASQYDSIIRSNIYYGLLRESPGLWCSTAVLSANTTTIVEGVGRGKQKRKRVG